MLYVFDNDDRNKFLKEFYEKENNITSNCKITNDLKEAEYIVFPIPLSKDGIHLTGTNLSIEEIAKTCNSKTIFSGGIKENVKEILEKENITCIDLMKLDEIAYLNAIPTAEGAIVKAITESNETLHNSNVLVLGFGRVGKILADKLKGLNANVFCEARSKKDLALIKALGYNVVELNNLDKFLGKMNVIFSTVPSMILDERLLNLVNRDTIIVDLASSPGSVDFEYAKKLGVKAFLELAIPTKSAPKSSARYLKEAIDNYIKGG